MGTGLAGRPTPQPHRLGPTVRARVGCWPGHALPVPSPRGRWRTHHRPAPVAGGLGAVAAQDTAQADPTEHQLRWPPLRGLPTAPDIQLLLRSGQYLRGPAVAAHLEEPALLRLGGLLGPRCALMVFPSPAQSRPPAGPRGVAGGIPPPGPLAGRARPVFERPPLYPGFELDQAAAYGNGVRPRGRGKTSLPHPLPHLPLPYRRPSKGALSDLRQHSLGGGPRAPRPYWHNPEMLRLEVRTLRETLYHQAERNGRFVFSFEPGGFPYFLR